MSEITLKISVDTADLDKVEAQLKRINGLLVSTGMKKPESVGFAADKFFITDGQVFLDAPFITRATINSAKIKIPTIDDALHQAAEEGARKGVEQARFEITTGINDKPEQQSAIAELDFERGEAKISGVIVSGKIKATAELMEKSQSKYEETMQRIDQLFSELQSQITSTRLASASEVDMLSARVSALDSSIAEINSVMATSMNALREEIAQVKANLC